MFMPTTGNTRQVQPVGYKDSRIAIVGDISDAFDMKSLRPFSGAAGTVLEQCLHAAGLIRGECYITNASKSAGGLEKFVNEKKKQITLAGQATTIELIEELNQCNPNVIVACGNLPFYMLTGVWGVNKYRGYIFESSGLARRTKVIPILHPRDAVWGAYTRRHIISTDLRKAKLESKFPELNRPKRELVYNFKNVGEILEWIEYFETQPELSVDIEVLNFCVSLVSLSSSPDVGVAIPFSSKHMSVDDEVIVWKALQRLLGNEKIDKVLQNAIFDIQFFLAQNGVVVRGKIKDTMIGHSVTYPELPMGLAFLGSIYCGAQEYWKSMVNFNDIKENS